MLNMFSFNSIINCSKASRGLFVRPRVMSIFTHIAISPSPSLRQSPNRCAIRAGRNLPDKEFRYLRTIIVIAGVHPRLSSKLPPDKSGFTPPLNVRTLARHQPLYIVLRLKQRLVFLVNSRLGSFAAIPQPCTEVHSYETGLIPKLRPLFCRVPKRGFSRSP